MRKAISLGIAALLVLALVGCDSFTPPQLAVDDGPRVLVTEDGRTMVRLDVGLVDSNGRALTDNMAIVATELFEVAFWTIADTTLSIPAGVYRSNWQEGGRAQVWVYTNDDGSPINYGGTAATAHGAILFVGYLNRTLLATGVVSAVDNVPGTNITKASRSVTFALTPFTNDVYGSNAAEAGTSSVKITGFNAVAADPFFDDPFNTVEIGGHDYPVFELDSATTYAMTYQIGGIPATGIVLAAAPRVIPRFIDVTGYYMAFDVTGTFTTPATHTAGTPVVGGTTPFGINLTTVANNGLIRIAIEVPVYAYSTATGATPPTLVPGEGPRTWYIRGGINNTQLDRGVQYDSDGGAILIGVDDYAEPSRDGWLDIDTTNP